MTVNRHILNTCSYIFELLKKYCRFTLTDVKKYTLISGTLFPLYKKKTNRTSSGTIEKIGHLMDIK